MIKQYLLLAFTLFVLSCQPKKQDAKTEKDSTSVKVLSPAAAKLTEEQKSAGWKLLFDGQSLDGWKFFKDQPNNSWEVIDGTLHCKPFVEGAENLRSDIMTKDQYENFELSIEWKISAQGNSGIMYGVTEEYDQPYQTGPEYQLLDDGNYPGESKATHMSGGVYDMYEPVNKKLNAVGEWNTTRIISKGNHVAHWLNEQKTAGYELSSDEWKKLKEISKWKDEPGYGLSTKGHIDLQDHAHEIWFRNIMIKSL